jgi:hypothetical protein
MAQDRIELLTTHVLALQVVQAACVILDLGWLLPRVLFELIDDLPTTLVEWDQSNYTRHPRNAKPDRSCHFSWGRKIAA